MDKERQNPKLRSGKKEKAIVLFSGGVDSTTCVYWAKKEFYDPILLSIEYGQRHSLELQYAEKLVEQIGPIEHIILRLNLRRIGGSALTDEKSVPKGGSDLDKEEHIPITYVPGRNLIFLSLAFSVAEARKCQNIFIGVNALDYSGYPDCRAEFIDQFEKTVNVGTKMGVEGKRIKIHTPLVNMSKAEIIQAGISMGVPYQYTWSCYDPQESKPCGDCDSCILRREGFKKAGTTDPARI